MDAIDALREFAKAHAGGAPQPGHKYRRREPTGNPEHPWRYVYEEPGRRGPARAEDSSKERARAEQPPPTERAPRRPSVPLSETLERVGRPRRGPAEQGQVLARHWVSSVTEAGLPADTQRAYKKGDKYTPERAALHERAYGSFLDHVPVVPSDLKPVAIVMMGGPASGKGTVLRHLLDEEQDFVNCNPDDCKELLPEYGRALHLREQGGVPVSAKDAALSVHEESSDMAEEVRKRAVAARKNLVLDGTGKNAEKYKKKIAELRAAGYHVRLMMPHVDIDEARQRAKDRANSTGRYVPDDFVEEAHHLIPGNFESVAAAADEAVLLDNSKPPPRPVWTSVGGDEQVLDEQFVSDFRKVAKERHGTAKERGWLKALRAAELRKAAKRELPPSVSMDDMLGRFEKDLGQAPDNATGLEDAGDVRRWRVDIQGKAGEDAREDGMREKAKGGDKQQGAQDKEREEETPSYATRRGGEFVYEDDEGRDPEARFVVSGETKEGAHYERPQDSEHHAAFGQWRSARKRGLSGKKIPRHLVEGALAHAERHHFDTKSHHEAFDDFQEHQGGESAPEAPPSHRAGKKAAAKKKPEDGIDLVGKIAAGDLDLDDGYQALISRLPPDAAAEDSHRDSISRSGLEYADTGDSARALEEEYFRHYGPLERSLDPIDALAPLMKGTQRGGRYKSRKRVGDHWVYEYDDGAPPSEIPGLAKDERDLAQTIRDIKTLEAGGKVDNLTLEHARKLKTSLEQVIVNKKKLVGKAGLHEFNLENRPKALSVPENLLYDYLCAFVEEALEHELREPEHSGAVTAEAIATPVLHELVAFIPKNPNLRRAAQKFEVTARSIAQVIEDKGMLRSRQPEARSQLGATTDFQSMEAMGAVGDHGPTGEVMLASAAHPWVQKDPLAVRALDLVRPELVRFADDAPLPAPAALHKARLRSADLLEDGPPARAVARSCLLHGDLFRDQFAHQPYVGCSCGGS